MGDLIKDDIDDKNVFWTETQIQIAICNYLKSLPEHENKFLFSSRINEGKRSRILGNLLKLAGLTAGEPDLDVWLANGKCIHIELKTLVKGTKKFNRLSKSQKDRHKQLKKIGHKVYIVLADTPKSGIDQLNDILYSNL